MASKSTAEASTPVGLTGIPAAVTSSNGTDSVSTSISTDWNKPCEEKWSGGVHLVLDCDLHAAWTLLSDFMGLPKWVPTISANRLVEGGANAVGCLRYCKGSGTVWVQERLLEFDDAAHYMSYRMEDNHFVFPEGFQGYVAKVQLGEEREGRTWVKWTYEVDPVILATRELVTNFMIGFYTDNLKYLEVGANKLVAQNTETAAAGNASLWQRADLCRETCFLPKQLQHRLHDFDSLSVLHGSEILESSM